MKFKFILLLLLASLTACVSADSFPLEGRPTVQLPFETQQGSHSLTVYLAQTEAEKAQGLMGVRSLPLDHGMLFMYDSMAQPIFWMKNMELSLDFIYLNETGEIVDLLENIPPCREEKDLNCERYHPQIPSQYVLEVPAGQVKKRHLALKDRFNLAALGRR